MIEVIGQTKEQAAAVETAQSLDQCIEMVEQDKPAVEEEINDKFLKELRGALHFQAATCQDKFNESASVFRS